ncbi:MAG TPA: dihydrodipicolinate synthase family protein, partial [Verrucomicrobiae bacterium]|nr:dihydrodipicolinate synthase family protein [Verrucomicrobiae bacterium]
MKAFTRREFIKTTALTAASVSVADVSRAQPTPAPSPKNSKTAVREALTGPCASVRLPFDRGGAIDYPSLEKQIEFVLHAGSKSVILTRGDSLYSLLTDDEISEVTKAVVKFVNHRALVVAADGSWATDKEVQFAKYCKETGVDMLMVLPPDWGGSNTISTLVAHYRAVAEHIPVMVVTNYLRKKPMSFSLKLLEALRGQVPGVAALKDDVGGEFARRVCLLAHDRWAIIA